MPKTLAFLLLLILSPAVRTQSRQMLVDLGSNGFATGVSGGLHWNDLDPGSLGSPLALVDSAGNSTGLLLTTDAQLRWEAADLTGTLVAAPGSDLEALGWPTSALRDSLYQVDGLPHVEFRLQQLDPAATYDFTFVASSMGFQDDRTAVYTVTGAQTAAAVLDASGNDSEAVSVRGIRPDTAATILIQARAYPTNSSDGRRFLLNAVRIVEHPGGVQPPRVDLSSNRLDFSRIQGSGPFSATHLVSSSDGSTPIVSLSVVDDVTGLPPTWIDVPATVTAGTPFPVTVRESSVGIGSYTATVTPSAAGYSADSGALSLTVRIAGGPRNLLFYGNSYSRYNSGVSDLCRWISVDAGRPEPYVISRFAPGEGLLFHLTAPLQVAAITETLLPGEVWDFVVLQGESTEATSALGNPTAFRNNAVALLASVRAHSPAARAVMFQTWARGQGHSFYLGANPPFSGPLDMHQQVDGTYALAVADMNAAFGPDSARRAAAGETAWLRNWTPALYTPDLSHPRPILSLMAAQTIFTAMEQAPTCPITPDYGTPSDLGNALLGFGIPLLDWRQATGYADRVADPVNRVYPGSGEDLVLILGVNGPGSLCPVQPAAMGDQVTLSIRSPAGAYAGRPILLYADVFPTGAPPGPFGPFPEVQYDPTRAVRLLLRGALPADGVTLGGPVTFSLSGFSVLFQALSLRPSDKTGNPTFTTSDGHELRF